MRTFFVTYSTGEFDSFVHHVYSIDANSKEEIIAGFEKAIEENERYHKKRSEVVGTYRPSFETRHETSNELYMQKYQEFLDDYGQREPFNVLGHNLSPFDKKYGWDKKEMMNYAELQVLSISEYINECRPEMEY